MNPPPVHRVCDLGRSVPGEGSRKPCSGGHLRPDSATSEYRMKLGGCPRHSAKQCVYTHVCAHACVCMYVDIRDSWTSRWIYSCA